VGLLTPGVSPLTCCCCCGGSGCGWTETWASLDAWVVAGDAAATAGHFTALPLGGGFALGSRSFVGGFSVATTLVPGAEDTTMALLITDPVSGLTAPLQVGQQWNLGVSYWFISGASVPVQIDVAPSTPEGPQTVTVQWNAAGEWSVTIGDAPAETGVGLTPDPSEVGLLATSSALAGDSTAIGPVTVACTELPPLPFGDVVLGLGPLFYFVLDQAGADNPVDSLAAVTASLNAPYTWGVTGPVAGLTALRLTGGSFDGTPRVSLSGDQTRLAFVKTTATDSVPIYDGDAALTVFGDTHAETWDSFGVSGGKAVFTRFNNVAWQTFTSTASVNDGDWHLIVATYDSNTLAVTLYVDGVADGSGSMTAHQAKGGISQFGRGYDIGDNFDGSLAHLVAWDRALSPAEVAALWAAAPQA
jgi:hypothetical protein